LDDAVAYVQWLEAREAAEAKGKKREWHWRLPTEAQWEKAARGTDGRIYPWGDAFDVIRCDTAESGNLATMPVGTYPTGASPRGALDMAGNVWEWTRSLYRRYHYRAGDGREPDMDVPMPPALGGPFYVLRGGSWKSSWTQARAAYRDQRMPDIVCDDVGFRLVIAPAQAT
jgi:formylglycine-generating enzyme required for sulfatase activity